MSQIEATRRRDNEPLNENRMPEPDADDSKMFSVRKIYLYSAISLTIISLVVATVLLSTYVQKKELKMEHDYTNCTMYDRKADTYSNMTCAEFKKLSKDICICIENINIPHDISGDRPPILYCKLDTIHQTNNKSYIQSMDKNQLSGVLSSTPAEECGEYRYSNGLPIYPCGAIANSIFNDTFIIKYNGSDTPLPTVGYGMIDEKDKVGFRNPPGDLKTSIQNFTKPVDWKFNAWELDKTNPDNNGVQNERFIGWMKTNWKLKPYYSFVDPVLKNGSYKIRINYYYPPSLYNGTRKIIISTFSTEYNNAKYWIGIVFLATAFTLIVLIIVGLYHIKRK